MSNSSNQKLSSWKVVEESLRCECRLHHVRSLSADDQDTFSCAILLQAMMLDDVLADRVPLRSSRVVRWSHEIIRHEPSEIGFALKEWLSFFRNYFPREKDILTYTGFKHQFRARFPFTGEFFSPVKEEVEEFLSSPTPSTFTIINQHLQFLSRLSLKDVDHSMDCLREYMENELYLASFDHDLSLYDDLNFIIREWFDSFSFEGFHPSHGPGAVAFLGRASKSEKYRNMGLDSMLKYFLDRIQEDGGDYSPLPPSPTLERRCQVVFVPKSVLTWRTISMEPATLQYYQQGIWSCLDRFMTRHPYLKTIIDVHDQSKNRLLAQKGSAERGRFSTIDLSAASDLVSWTMVKRVFRGTPLLRGCYATRSRVAELPDGSLVQLHKYAPMGSALCFPIECIVFAAVCEYVARIHGVGRKDSVFSVYGDDIVVRADLASDVVYTLQKCGFRINQGKSFIAQNLPFRESCGGEFFSGVDVSPFRISRKFSAKNPTVRHPDVYQAHIDGANLAHQHGLAQVRLWFIHRLFKLPQKLLPLFGEGYCRLYSDQPTNFHLIKRWKNDWQCFVVNSGSNTRISNIVLGDELEETIRLFEWFRLARFRTRSCFMESDVITVDISRVKSKLGTRVSSYYD